MTDSNFKVCDNVRFIGTDDTSVPFGTEGVITEVEVYKDGSNCMSVKFPHKHTSWLVLPCELEEVIDYEELENIAELAAVGAEAMRVLQGRTDIECRGVGTDEVWTSYPRRFRETQSSYDSSELEFRVKPDKEEVEEEDTDPQCGAV